MEIEDNGELTKFETMPTEGTLYLTAVRYPPCRWMQGPSGMDKGQVITTLSAWTGQHFVEGEAEERGYIPLYLHPAPPPEGYQLVPIEPTEAMVAAGQEIAHELITANCCKSMNGLGGGKTWQEFKNTCKNLELCEMYLNNDIDSVEAIYRAMLAAAKEMK